MKNSIKEEFVDERGNKSEIIISTNDDKGIKLGAKYKLQRPESDNKYLKKGAKPKGIFTSEIGVKSEGFAPIFTLGLIIAIAALVAFYILWRI